MRLAAAFLICIAAAAQQAGTNAPQGAAGTATFTSSAQLVVETVAVTAKDGRPVEILTAKDFTVTENGVPQDIRFFEHQKLPETAAPALTPSPTEHIKV